jgi:hypothetical protein
MQSQLIAAIPGHFSKLLRRYQEEVGLRRALHNVLIELRGWLLIYNFKAKINLYYIGIYEALLGSK